MKRLTYEFVKEQFAKEGYELLSKEYKNSRTKLKYRCPKGHEHGITWADWKNGNRCPYCVIIASKGEIEVRDFIKSLGIEVLPNNRNQIFNPEINNGLELDIFMPNLNKAIEYNGEYWHQDERNKVNNDLLKQKLCRSKSIDLLTIWENNWKKEKDVCKDKIKEFIFN